MVRNAEKLQKNLEKNNEVDGPVFKIKDDPRITPVGKFLRRTSLDELPQLINILKGEMSLVGPRPPIPQEVKKYESWQRRRLSMKPGLPCIWQVSGRNSITFADWMQMDLQYIDNWSLWLDVKILALTAKAVIFGSGR
jgi:lipopolysaccharide/colanic/teichoic acid biosynthesis glycosyltransferase